MKIAVGLALMALATVAGAQRTGSHIGQKLRPSNAGDMLGIMADCYASLRPIKSEAWLKSWPGSKDEKALVDSETAFFERCTQSDKIVMDNRSIAFRYKAMRRRLGVAMARRALGSGRPGLAENPTFAFADVKGRSKSGEHVDATEVAHLDFGHCVATSAWAASIEFVRARPATSDEALAFKAIVPALGPCISEGANLTLTRDRVREAIGEPMFHLLQSPTSNGER